MHKKMIAVVLILSILSCFYTTAFASEENVENDIAKKSEIAELVFDKTPKVKNIKRYYFANTDVSKKITAGGKEAVEMVRADGCHYLMIDLDDDAFPKTEKGQTIDVTVEYYDKGYGLFTLRYDSVKNSVSNICEDHVDVVKLTDDREWKTHTFHVNDAAFGGTFGGADVVVGLWSTRTGSLSSENIIIRSVQVERVFPQKPVIINLKSEHYGNIFSAEDSKEMYFDFNNVTDTNINLELEYFVADDNMNVLDSGSFSKEVYPNKEEQIQTINADVTKYGLYKVFLRGNMKYMFEGEEFVKEIDNSFNFSVANKFVKGEEKNPYFGACTHLALQEKRLPEVTSKIAAEAGLGVIRDEPKWHNIEKQKGIYDFSSALTSFPKNIAENGTSMLLLSNGGNTLYASCGNVREGMPNVKEDMEAYAENILRTIEQSNGAIKYVEIWNEPNITTFNRLKRTPEEYAELLKVCYPIIKNKYPDIAVIGCSTAGVDFDWIERTFAAGGYDYMDAVSVHPYDWSGTLRYDYYHEIMGKLKETMAKYGDMKPIWATELGWATSTCTEEEQARYLVQSYAFLKANDYCDVITMYEFQNSGTDALDQEHNFGMINYYENSSTEINTLFTGGVGKDVKFEDVSTPWSAKPSYLSVTAMNKLIGNAECVETVELGDDIKAYRFARKDGKSAVIIWSDKDVQNISVKLDCTKAEICDLYSNSKTVESANGVFNITVQKDQSYILGDFSTITLAEALVDTGDVAVQWAKNDKLTFNFNDKLKRNLRVEVEAADAFEVIDNNGIANGFGYVTMHGNPTNELTDYQITFNLYDGEKLCYTETKNIKFVENVSLSVEKASLPNALDRMRLNVKVTNNASFPLSGKVRIIEPEISTSANSPAFSNLGAGASVVVPINLQRELKKRLCTVKIEVELSDGTIIDETTSLSFGEIKYADDKPKIDGIVSPSEWKGTWMLVDQKKDIGKTGFSGWLGADDCSFCCNLMWDEENLYMCFVAKDDKFSQNYTGENIWQGDSMQVGLREADSNYNASYNELGFALTSIGNEIYRYSSYSGQNTGEVLNSKCAYAKTADGVIYEIAIPWDEALAPNYIPAVGNKIAFSALFNDNDGNGRRGWLQYTDGIGATKNALSFDVIALTK